ncbi:HNH endonuclease [Helicobacter brantae]|uniref:HNH endonuclease n=2 Tax=Helicobacter brantae TaxID=375927 RepID=A0A3D8IVG0_9HELI|nr:HNH endonuclease [Helicobacter brantae]
MFKKDLYLEALKQCDDWVSISEWANKIAELYPEEIERIDEKSQKQQKPTEGITQLIRNLSAKTGRGDFSKNIKIDDEGNVRKVKYITEEEKALIEQEDIEEEDRRQIIKQAESKMSQKELYRIKEFSDICSILKNKWGIIFEVDHAYALKGEKQGKHHPDNLQLLLKMHNGAKNNKDWTRFTFEEQEKYIRNIVETQKIICERMGSKIDDEVVDLLMMRLKAIF